MELGLEFDRRLHSVGGVGVCDYRRTAWCRRLRRASDYGLPANAVTAVAAIGELGAGDMADTGGFYSDAVAAIGEDVAAVKKIAEASLAGEAQSALVGEGKIRVAGTALLKQKLASSTELAAVAEETSVEDFIDWVLKKGELETESAEEIVAAWRESHPKAAGPPLLNLDDKAVDAPPPMDESAAPAERGASKKDEKTSAEQKQAVSAGKTAAESVRASESAAKLAAKKTADAEPVVAGAGAAKAKAAREKADAARACNAAPKEKKESKWEIKAGPLLRNGQIVEETSKTNEELAAEELQKERMTKVGQTGLAMSEIIAQEDTKGVKDLAPEAAEKAHDMGVAGEDKEWDTDGQGKTGEAHLVAGDTGPETTERDWGWLEKTNDASKLTKDHFTSSESSHKWVPVVARAGMRLEGHLFKKSPKRLLGWQERWCVLEAVKGHAVIYYWETKADAAAKKVNKNFGLPHETFQFCDVLDPDYGMLDDTEHKEFWVDTVGESDGKYSHRTFHFRVKSEEKKLEWLRALNPMHDHESERHEHDEHEHGNKGRRTLRKGDHSSRLEKELAANREKEKAHREHGGGAGADRVAHDDDAFDAPKESFLEKAAHKIEKAAWMGQKPGSGGPPPKKGSLMGKTDSLLDSMMAVNDTEEKGEGATEPAEQELPEISDEAAAAAEGKVAEADSAADGDAGTGAPSPLLFF